MNAGKPVTTGVWNGFGQVALGAGDSLDRAVRLQTVDSDNWQQPPVTVRRQQQPTTTLPLTNWTGDGSYHRTYATVTTKANGKGYETVTLQ
ncbi:hypothetical protein OGM63_24805 [Plectonema radiosum NIES-515]|uniref:Uncharacterized protein n=1 Tax=Plectonema radiosum NIES-515 TaxID=2986073 RepID=A0ABT3B725_9CYAN|nr:hypothetical protein [Plectonema radiosum]MCV3216684.1 hypothetical protein [Plectonema radiosum NIES-515]